MSVTEVHALAETKRLVGRQGETPLSLTTGMGETGSCNAATPHTITKQSGGSESKKPPEERHACYTASLYNVLSRSVYTSNYTAKTSVTALYSGHSLYHGPVGYTAYTAIHYTAYTLYSAIHPPSELTHRR